jgi:hypothetical protein
LPAGAGNKTVENSLNYLIDAVDVDPNGNISDSYDPTAAYVKGDLCIYENVLYICTAPTTGTFDPSKWTTTTIDNVIGDLATLTTSVKSSLVGAVNEIARYTPVYGNTASGAIATFDTSLALPLQDCTTEAGANKVVNVSGNVTDLATYIRGIYQGIYGFVDLGSLNWTYDAESVPSNPYFFCQRDTVKNSTQNLLCHIYTLSTAGVANMPDMSMKSNNKGQVLIVNRNYTDANTFKTAMSGVYLIYELETPTTPTITQAQLTTVCASFGVLGTAYDLPLTDKPTTYVGTNNVFSDNGNTSVVYVCSLKDYIDRQ